MNQEFYDWIENATSKIASPEQKKKARLKLETEISTLLKNNDCKTVLLTLGDAEAIADKLKEEYSVTPDIKKHKKFGYLLLLISAIILAYTFVMLTNQTDSPIPSGITNFSTLLSTGKAIGSGFFCSIIFGIIGIKLVFTKK